MIRLTFSTAVGLYTTFSILGIFSIWLLFEGLHTFRNFAFTQRYFWRCSICTTPYVDSQGDDFSRCPHCGSLNQRGRSDDH